MLPYGICLSLSDSLHSDDHLRVHSCSCKGRYFIVFHDWVVFWCIYTAHWVVFWCTYAAHHFLLLFGLAMRLAGSQFPNQGWTQATAVEVLSPNHWTTGTSLLLRYPFIYSSSIYGLLNTHHMTALTSREEDAFKNQNGVAAVQASREDPGGWGFRHVPASLRTRISGCCCQTQGHHQPLSEQCPPAAATCNPRSQASPCDYAAISDPNKSFLLEAPTLIPDRHLSTFVGFGFKTPTFWILGTCRKCFLTLRLSGCRPLCGSDSSLCISTVGCYYFCWQNQQNTGYEGMYSFPQDQKRRHKWAIQGVEGAPTIKALIRKGHPLQL